MNPHFTVAHRKTFNQNGSIYSDLKCESTTYVEQVSKIDSLLDWIPIFVNQDYLEDDSPPIRLHAANVLHF